MPDFSIISGPILRHVCATEFTLWLATTSPLKGAVKIADGQQVTLIEQQLDQSNLTSIQVGTFCFIHLIHLKPEQELPENQLLSYDLNLVTEQGTLALNELVPELCFDGYNTPTFTVKSNISRVLHGSCRKPHHPQTDALVRVEEQIEKSLTDIENKPSLLMFSGDQVYVDDVAGPMLDAIHQLSDKLGLFDENWEGGEVTDMSGLLQSDHCYYLREQLLPQDKANQALLDSFFEGKRKPIFTSVGAHNHLISLSEVIAMYLLVWSDTPWKWIEIGQNRDRIRFEHLARYDKETPVIEDFSQQMTKVRRSLAHIPVYMIFDDHDVTDDWNLTRGWEEAAYGNPFSKRILGNALAGYFLCQGWGNKPDNYQHLLEQVEPCFTDSGFTEHDKLVDAVLDWDNWHYVLDTQPKMVILDTRTHRWRSESSAGEPSGLMDWESLSEMQQELINQPAVILVSPAPIFGVKLIEVIQRIFTFCGKPLVVDAENWMAHPGSANVMLNIFLHAKTPPNFIILSGDVHYSFAYDVALRNRKNSPKILQITASGIKNAFPDTLLKWFDRINLALFGSKSPLNLFTKRRNMKVNRRSPDGSHSRVLFNHSGIGEVILADKIEDVQVRVLTSDDREITFR